MKMAAKLVSIAIILAFLSGCSRPPTQDFQHLVAPKTHNYFLVCPEKYCNISPGMVSPVFPVSAADLYNDFNVIVSKSSNVNFVYEIPEQGQFGLTAYSTLLRFPSDITLQFIALSPATSTVAIFSKSRYGFYDFGENQRRVQGWISELNRVVQHQG